MFVYHIIWNAEEEKAYFEDMNGNDNDVTKSVWDPNTSTLKLVRSRRNSYIPAVTFEFQFFTDGAYRGENISFQPELYFSGEINSSHPDYPNLINSTKMAFDRVEINDYYGPNNVSKYYKIWNYGELVPEDGSENENILVETEVKYNDTSMNRVYEQFCFYIDYIYTLPQVFNIAVSNITKNEREPIVISFDFNEGFNIHTNYATFLIKARDWQDFKELQTNEIQSRFLWYWLGKTEYERNKLYSVAIKLESYGYGCGIVSKTFRMEDEFYLPENNISISDGLNIINGIAYISDGEKWIPSYKVYVSNGINLKESNKNGLDGYNSSII